MSKRKFPSTHGLAGVLLGALVALASSSAASKCTEPEGSVVGSLKYMKQYHAWQDCVKKELDKEEADRKPSKKKADAFREPSKKKMSQEADAAPTATGTGATSDGATQR